MLLSENFIGARGPVNTSYPEPRLRRRQLRPPSEPSSTASSEILPNPLRRRNRAPQTLTPSTNWSALNRQTSKLYLLQRSQNEPYPGPEPAEVAQPLILKPQYHGIRSSSVRQLNQPLISFRIVEAKVASLTEMKTVKSTLRNHSGALLGRGAVKRG